MEGVSRAVSLDVSDQAVVYTHGPNNYTKCNQALPHVGAKCSMHKHRHPALTQPGAIKFAHHSGEQQCKDGASTLQELDGL